MKVPTNLGIAFSCLGDPNSLLRSAREAERAGFRNIWLVEVQDVDTVALAASISQVTKKIGIATGVVNSNLRLPTLLAMGAVTLSKLSYGRAILGVGAGIPPMTYTTGLESNTPLVRLGETLEILRLALSGDTVVFNGKLFEVNGFRLTLKSRFRIPIYGAAMGLKTLEVVVKHADGAIIMVPTINQMKEVVRIVKITPRGKSHRQPGFPVACHFITALSEDGLEAERLAKQAVATYSSFTAYRASFQRLGFGDELTAIDRARAQKASGAWRSVPTDMAESLIIYGTAEECIEKIAKFVSAGVTNPIIYPFMRDSSHFPKTVDRTIASFGKLLGDS